MKTVSAEISKIHKRLEPRKTVVKQKDYERLYAKNPLVQRQGESNPSSVIENHMS